MFFHFFSLKKKMYFISAYIYGGKTMPEKSAIFKKHYEDYLEQIRGVDKKLLKERLGVHLEGNDICLPFFQTQYRISNQGIEDESGSRPPYGICVILAKYILLCPDQDYNDPQWVSFRDFKRSSHFTNVNFFTSDTEQAIVKSFSQKPESLSKACVKIGGTDLGQEMPYDLAYEIPMLPRINQLLLFNAADEEFPAQCKVLFEKHSEFYLDPESLAMTGAALANRLVNIQPMN